jgi:multidrug efflux system membrane fusion protein
MPGRRSLASPTLAAAAFRVPLLLFFAFAACSRKPAPEPPPPAPVRVAIAELTAVPVELSAIGTVDPSATVTVQSRVTGLITHVAFQEGQDVNAGDVLFTLDRRPFEAALREAEAVLQKDLAQAENADAEAKRYAALVEAGVATRQDAEQKRAAAHALAATVKADRAAIATRKLDLEFTTIRAPISGRTGAVLVREGNLVRANDTNLVVINRVQPVFVSFSVPEADLRELMHYMAQGPLPATASLPQSNEPVAQGQITFVDNAADKTTGTVRVKAVFPNQDLHLWPGVFVQVRATLTTRQDALVVPAAALQSGTSGPFVFVVAPDDTAEMRAVTTGERVAGERVVINSGVTAGEKVVTDGQLRLFPGAKVTILPGAAPAIDGGTREGP